MIKFRKVVRPSLVEPTAPDMNIRMASVTRSGRLTRLINSRNSRRSSNQSSKKHEEQSDDEDKYYRDMAKSGITFGELNELFALSVTAHGFARVAMTKRHRLRQIFWAAFVVCALAVFIYHVSFLLSNFFNYPVATTTEEIHAEELEFPAITICNLNNLKKTKFEAFLEEMSREQDEQAKQTTELPDFLATTAATNKGTDELQCFRTTDQIVNRSRAMDLSDMWISLVSTKSQIRSFGHQAADMIVQCTYNSKDCFNSSNSILSNVPYASPRYGLCHSLTLNDEERKIVKSGAGLGLQMTINIERPEYLDIASGEFGARILVHAVGSRPSLDTGGIILHPGTKTYIAAKMRQIIRMPEPYRGCTMNFSDSPLRLHLEALKLDTLIGKNVYTLEYCQTVCSEAYLFHQCKCLDELAVEKARERFSSCDPCNAEQSLCRRNFYRTFTSSAGGTACSTLCRAECNEIRYDITTSQSEWPNYRHEYYAVTRFAEVNKRVEQSGINWTNVMNSTDEDIDGMPGVDEFRRNYLRVHVYIQEMNYMRIKDESSYLMSQLIADLGGCLGLYIGVSVITLLEFTEHFVRCLHFSCERIVVPIVIRHKKRLLPKFLQGKTPKHIVVPVGLPQNAMPAIPYPQPADDEIVMRMGRRRPEYFDNERQSRQPALQIRSRDWLRRDNYHEILQTRQRLQGLSRPTAVGDSVAETVEEHENNSPSESNSNRAEEA